MRSAGDLKNMAGSLLFIIEEPCDCNIELQQCLESSNDDEGILFPFDGILAGLRVRGNTRSAETFLSSLFRAIHSKINITEKPLAKCTFCESFPKKALGSGI